MRSSTAWAEPLRGLILALALALPGAAAAQGQPPILGQQFDMGGQTWIPQVGLELDQGMEPQPGLYRQIALDWRAGPLQAGRYPAAAFAARREGVVGLSLTIDPSGRLTACAVTTPSGTEALDAHACPHLLAHARFHPGLGANGDHVGGTLAARLSYTLVPSMATLADPGAARPPLRREPRPLSEIDFAGLGIDPRTPAPRDVYGIGATLAVDAAGAVTACLLHSPTYDDALDKRACDRLMAMRFEPALDADGRPAPGRYAFGLEWPRRR